MYGLNWVTNVCQSSIRELGDGVENNCGKHCEVTQRVKNPRCSRHRGFSYFFNELLLGGPKDLSNGVNLAKEFVGDGHVIRLLRFAGGLGRGPKEFVKVRVRL